MTGINTTAPVIGSTVSRPWRYYLLSDLCADDVWSYGDLEKFECDDYLTTRAEMSAGADNRYNMAAANQAAQHLVGDDLRAAGLRVVLVAPGQHQDAHGGEGTRR